MSRDELRLGTRKSPLALAQSRQVAAALAERHPGIEVELVPILTSGDREAGSLGGIGGKGLFTRELEAELLAGSIDLAVHSLKDLPVQLPPGLRLAAIPIRADPRDVLVSAAATRLEYLPQGAVILTGSLRRRAQLLHCRPDLEVQPIRGNVETRLRRWREEGATGIVLAAAGLHRLGLRDLPAHPLDPALMLPAPGQGALAVEVKAGSSADVFCRALNDPATARAAEGERAVTAAFGGDCTLPLAAWARDDGGKLRLTALLALPDGSRIARGEASGEHPLEVASACVEAMRGDGADAILAELRP